MARRKQLNLTQKELGLALDRSLGWVRQIEQGQLRCPAYAILALEALEARKGEK